MEEEINEPMGEKKRINESHPTTTTDITDLTGKNPVTFPAWQVLLIIYNILSTIVCIALQITEPFHLHYFIL